MQVHGRKRREKKETCVALTVLALVGRTPTLVTRAHWRQLISGERSFEVLRASLRNTARQRDLPKSPG
eukprot:6190092-Pleurochrysis_carterae.AAC.1